MALAAAEDVTTPTPLSAPRDGDPAKPDSAGAKSVETQTIPKNNLKLVFSALVLTVFLAAMDQTIVATAVPSIVADIGGGNEDSSSYTWIGTAYLLMAACLSPLYGKVSDIWGRKIVLYSSVLIFLLGSALCGAAQNLLWLIVCRGVQGIGGGGILQIVQIIISDIVPLADRGKYSGAIGATWGLASVLGPVIGGSLTERVTWRWIFFINLPTGGLALALIFFNLRLNPHQGSTWMTFFKTFDFAGLFLLVVGIVFLLVGFAQGESQWNDASTITLLVLGILLLAGAVVNEIYTTRSAIIPARIFKTRTTLIILLCTFMHSFSFIGASYYIPLYFQVRGSNALQAGLLVIPFSFGSAIVSIISGFILAKTGNYRVLITGAFGIMTLGFALLATLDQTSSYVQTELYLLVASIGVGPLFQAPLIALQSAVSVSQMATSTSCFGLIRTLGGTIGISVGGAIYSSELSRRLRGIANYQAQTGAELSGNVSGLVNIEPVDIREQVLFAYTRSLMTIWIIAAPLLFVAFIASFFLKTYTLQRKIVRTGKDGEPIAAGESNPESEMELAEKERKNVENSGGDGVDVSDNQAGSESIIASKKN